MQHKKILKVRSYVYDYCIFNKTKCKGYFTVRKDWFEKNHVKSTCPTSDLIDDRNLANQLTFMIQFGNFKTSEFACKCGCGQNKINKELIDKLQKLRDLVKVPIYIESGYRCLKHNVEVGGVPNSQHLLGKAADIRIIKRGKWLTGREMYVIVEDSGLFKNGGIGVYPNFLHIDVRGNHARWFVN